MHGPAQALDGQAELHWRFGVGASSLKVAQSKDAAIMMFNDAVAGTRLQPGIKGRGTVQLPDGSFREMQAFYTPRVPATEEQDAALTDHERAILNELQNVDSFWPRRVVDSALRGYDPEDDERDAKAVRDVDERRRVEQVGTRRRAGGEAVGGRGHGGTRIVVASGRGVPRPHAG